MIKTLEIQYFRGFRDNQTIAFAVPKDNKPGSGLTIIVGPNNTGKTSILEALLLTQHSRFKDCERYLNESPVIRYTGVDDSITECTNDANGSEVKYPKKEFEFTIEFIPSRRNWDSISRNGHVDKSSYVSGNQNPRQGGGGQVADILTKISKNEEEEKSKLNALMKKLIPGFTDWTIDTDDSGDYIKYCANDVQHKTNYLGEGVLSLFKICVNLIFSDKQRIFSDKQRIFSDKQRILVIDEPELSLHPQAKKELAKILSKESANRQVIVCTHSPHFANWSDLKNGASLIRLNKIDDKRTTVHRLTIDSISDVEKIITDWQKPQLLDTVAKELLFANKVLFLEGQEDVGLIKKWITEQNSDDINFDIFGYGVGGFTNMSHFLKLAQDLGLTKVAIILDKGENEDAKMKELQEKYPLYHIKQLPTEDIRDKKASGCSKCNVETKKAKEGVFNDRGEVNEKHKKEFEEIMHEIIKYFQ